MIKKEWLLLYVTIVNSGSSFPPLPWSLGLTFAILLISFQQVICWININISTEQGEMVYKATLIIYHGHLLSHCEKSVKHFVKTSGFLCLAAYATLDDTAKPAIPLHNCCGFCAISCKCNGVAVNLSHYLRTSIQLELVQTIWGWPVNEEDKSYLKVALQEVQERLAKGKSLLDGISGHGFSMQLIKDIVEHSSRIFRVSDILDTCPVHSIDSALAILVI